MLFGGHYEKIVKWFWGVDINPDEVQTQGLVAVIVNIIILNILFAWDILQQQLIVFNLYNFLLLQYVALFYLLVQWENTLLTGK